MLKPQAEQIIFQVHAVFGRRRRERDENVVNDPVEAGTINEGV